MLKLLLLFDFDGVLADSLDIYAAAVSRCLQRIGTPIVKNQEDYLDLFEGNFYESMAARGVDLAAFDRAAKEILPGINYEAMKPFDGLAPVLEVLADAHRLAVISSNRSGTIQRMLERFGFINYFEDILGSDFLFSKKDKIDHALSKYGIDPGKTYYIGDTTGDIIEARAAGVRTVAVAWGWHRREKLMAAHPDFLIDTPEDLLTVGLGLKVI